MSKKAWDFKTLYKDHPIFGIGMSSWHTMEYWNHKEDWDIDFFKQFPASSDYTHAIENIEIWW